MPGSELSFSDFGRIPESERTLIDYIFVNDGFETLFYAVLPDTLDGGCVSDHAPVMAKLRFLTATPERNPPGRGTLSRDRPDPRA